MLLLLSRSDMLKSQNSTFDLMCLYIYREKHRLKALFKMFELPLPSSSNRTPSELLTSSYHLMSLCDLARTIAFEITFTTAWESLLMQLISV